ncbi:MAG TPA: GNAT family N-acetyltransferase [Actinocrinis sp.]|nr:GNAT family N-acetyltransferase [Actinocrinis sp.]
MDAQISPAALADFHQVLADHPRYWDDRDLRKLHLLAMVQEFGSTCLVARDVEGIRGYLFGFVTPRGIGYVHLIATRDDARGEGLGRRLYEAFAEAAQAEGATRLKAITSVTNRGSIAFHASLGFDVQTVDEYYGPGHGPMIVFRHDLPFGSGGDGDGDGEDDGAGAGAGGTAIADARE